MMISAPPDLIFHTLTQNTDSKARAGMLYLPHGPVSTPVFMPVGTNGTVKAIDRDSLEDIGFDIILSNTYHLYLRPGKDVLEKAGGLHRWSRWRKNILTDSGGFQVFSLAPFRKLSEDGVEFRSHIDGSYHMLTPEKVVEIQTIIGSDIQMQLDVCTGWGTEYREAEKALEVTGRWLKRAMDTWMTKKEHYEGQLFGIVQGNFYKDLRVRSLEKLLQIDPPGIAIGGLSVGEPFDVYTEFLSTTADMLPNNKPRYVMGIGTPEYILEAIGAGIDMFDCVFPTRIARNGMVFTREGTLTLKKERNEFDFGPIDAQCSCKVCREYSRSYLRHLYKSGEILSSMLATYHNLFFLKELVIDARNAIIGNHFMEFKKSFLSNYSGKS